MPGGVINHYAAIESIMLIIATSLLLLIPVGWRGEHEGLYQNTDERLSIHLTAHEMLRTNPWYTHSSNIDVYRVIKQNICPLLCRECSIFIGSNEILVQLLTTITFESRPLDEF